MKYQFRVALVATLFSIIGYSQSGNTISLDYSEITMPGRRYNHQAANTQGSPYLNKMFSHAKVGENIDNAFLRYNAFNDEFEFNSKL